MTFLTKYGARVATRWGAVACPEHEQVVDLPPKGDQISKGLAHDRRGRLLVTKLRGLCEESAERER